MSARSESLKILTGALVKVQAGLEGAKKDSKNPFFKSSYADLSSVWEAIRQPLAENGFAVVQTTEVGTTGACLVTTLLHTSGEWISGTLPLNPKTQDPQGMGSAITYARRYALMAIIGVIAEDDDGESAMGRKAQPTKPKAAPSDFAPGRDPVLDLPVRNLSGFVIPMGQLKGVKLGDKSDDFWEKYLISLGEKINTLPEDHQIAAQDIIDAIKHYLKDAPK